jgi:Pyruvate/2-oxoacid:ferredoxin oxidoreductase delta subunit
MPAFEYEVETAVKEGVKIMELLSPSNIAQDGGEYILTLQPMKRSGMETDTGRARVVPDGEITQELRVQEIFTAIGAEPSDPWQLPSEENADIVRLSHCAFVPDNPPFLFGGDLTNPTKSVADAIASGKQSAMALDTFFKNGLNAIKNRLNSCLVGNGQALSMERYMDGRRSFRNPDVVSFEDINIDYFSPAPRAKTKSSSLNEQMNPFDEIETTFTIRQIKEETRRCFNCGICNGCDNCRIFCPEVAVGLQGDKRRINFDYCKGCGICVVECPRNAMVLEEEV